MLTRLTEFTLQVFASIATLVEVNMNTWTVPLPDPPCCHIIF